MPRAELDSPVQMEFAFGGKGRILAALRRKSEGFSRAAQSASTRRCYASDWAIFERWCGEFGVKSVPASAESVRLFVVDQAEKWSVATVSRRVAAIAAYHRAADVADATKAREVVEVVCGLRRSVEGAGRGKAALTVAELLRLVKVARAAETPCAERDGAILLVGFAGGFRRSELCALELRDVRIERRGALVTVRRSKTDQEGRGRLVPIARGRVAARCPVAALELWIRERGSWAGALFCKLGTGGGVRRSGLSGSWIWHIVKACAGGAGLDAERYGAHSLRAGLVTAAHERGRSDTAIMQTTGHRRVETLNGYVRKAPGRLFAQAAAVGLF